MKVAEGSELRKQRGEEISLAPGKTGSEVSPGGVASIQGVVFTGEIKTRAPTIKTEKKITFRGGTKTLGIRMLFDQGKRRKLPHFRRRGEFGAKDGIRFKYDLQKKKIVS